MCYDLKCNVLYGLSTILTMCISKMLRSCGRVMEGVIYRLD
jgi:hypothetical protein